MYRLRQTDTEKNNKSHRTEVKKKKKKKKKERVKRNIRKKIMRKWHAIRDKDWVIYWHRHRH